MSTKAERSKEAFRKGLAEYHGELPCQNADDPDMWFATPGSAGAFEAKKRCFQECPLLQVCAEYALENGVPNGIWGGVDEDERERNWKRRKHRPTDFREEMDAATLPMLQARRDFENFDSNHGDPYEEAA